MTQKAINKSVKTQLLISTVVLLLIALGICAFFTLATFDEFYSQAIIDRYALLTERLRGDLENSLCPGTNSTAQLDCEEVNDIYNMQSITSLLIDFQNQIDSMHKKLKNSQKKGENADDAVLVSVAALESTVLYSSEQSLIGLESSALKNDTASVDAAKYAKQHGVYSIVLPLRDKKGKQIAKLSVKLDENLVKLRTNNLLEQHNTVLVVVALGGVAILILLIIIAVPATLKDQSLPMKKTATILLIIVCTAQILSSVGGGIVFKNNYLQLSKEKTWALAEWIKADIEGHFDEATIIERLTASIPVSNNVDLTPGATLELEKQMVTVYQQNGQPIYDIFYTDGIFSRSTVTGAMSSASRIPSGIDEHHILLDLQSRGRTAGYLSAYIDNDKLYDKLLSIGLELLITVVISILCLVELLILVFKYLEKQLVSGAQSKTVHYSVMRPTIFLFLFGIDLSAALIPLQMERLYEPILGLPKDIVLGLPVSAMFSTVGITFIISGIWMDRRGWHEPFLVGVLLTGVSKFYAWLAPDAIQFIIAMAGIGFGYGLALMAAQGFVMANTTDKDKAHGIAYFFAGVYAGSIGGTAIGAMLAERIGYNPVFLIGSLCIFASFGYGMTFLRKVCHKPSVDLPDKLVTTSKRWGFIRFLMNRNVLTLVLFCSIPAAVGVIGFLNYFSPVYLSRLGVSESIIGGVLTLYGISLVYISPLISKLIDTTDRHDYFIVIGCIIGSCAFLSFYFLSGLVATIVAVLLLGLSGSCLQSSQTTYTLKLKATQELGAGKAVAIVRATSRVGQMIGPMVFSWLVMANDIEEAVTYFGLVYLFIVLLFVMLTNTEGRTAARSVINQELIEPSRANN